MAFKFFPRLSQNFSHLLDSTDDYDVFLRVGTSPNIKDYRLHSVILKSRSPYFKIALSQNWISKQDNNIIYFNKPNITPSIFDIIVRYMYAGILDLNEQAGSDILDLIIASDELLLDELVTSVQEYLIENQTEWLQQNFVQVLQVVYQIESCVQLHNYYLETICEDPEHFFNSPDFLKLEKSILLEFVKREDLKIDEVELWNFLIKWGIAHSSELKEKDATNLSVWSENDFLALKDTLNQFIEHIRFYDIFTKEFHSYIWPFRKVLPEAIFEDIVSFYMAHTKPKQELVPRHGKIVVDSMIIKPKHAAILANWIQRKDPLAKIPKDHKYNFNLIYRKSRDGHDINTIRSNCNGQGACILIIKVKENDTIIGGYNPCGWGNHPITNYNPSLYSSYGNYYYWAYTSESFIYSLGNGKDSKYFNISRVRDSNYAMYESHYVNMTLNFGNSDLVINGNTGTCKQAYYESNILDASTFNIEEMEIFRFYQG